MLAAALVLAAGCNGRGEEAPDLVSIDCAPTCAERDCGTDGCGGTCGTCAPDETCSVGGGCTAAAGSGAAPGGSLPGAGNGAGSEGDNVAEPEPPDCSQGCADLGWQCGEHCGEDCGTCSGPQEGCVDGSCVCQPACAGKSCVDPDGCGGTCGPCPRDVSCTDCALRLSVVEREESDGLLRSVTLAVDYEPEPGTPMPAIVALRLKIDGPARLDRVGLGEVALEAGKKLVVDPRSGRPYRVHDDGVVELMVLSPGSTRRIEAGRWIFLKLTISGDGAAASGPVLVRLLPTGEVFAPPAADEALFGVELDSPVVIRPEGVNAP